MPVVSRIAPCLVGWTFLVGREFSAPKKNRLFTQTLALLSHQKYPSHLFFLVLPIPGPKCFFNQLSIASTGVFADGPGAYLFHGVVEQQYVFHVMDFALCLSESKQKSCEKHVNRGGKPKSKSVASFATSPSLYVLLIAALRLFF